MCREFFGLYAADERVTVLDQELRISGAAVWDDVEFDLGTKAKSDQPSDNVFSRCRRHGQCKSCVCAAQRSKPDDSSLGIAPRSENLCFRLEAPEVIRQLPLEEFGSVLAADIDGRQCVHLYQKFSSYCRLEAALAYSAHGLERTEE